MPLRFDTFRYNLVFGVLFCSQLEQYDLGSCKAQVIHNLIKVQI